MALIKCPECGHEISDTIDTCTYCGFTLKKATKNKSKKPFIIGILFAALIVCMGIAYLVVIKPNNLMQQAENLIARGKYGEAETVLSHVKDNSKKEELLISITLNEVQECLANGELESASRKIASIPEEKISPEITEKISILQAESLITKGEYDAADELLASVAQDDAIVEMRTQLSYESRIFNCIGKLKKVLKNPDSLTIYEVHFYVDTPDTDESGTDETDAGSVEETSAPTATQALGETEEMQPQCLLYYGAQNGFGGNTTAYALFKWDYECNEYSLYCTANSLDSSDLNTNSDDFLYDMFAQIEIKDAMEQEEIGTFDIDRIRTLLMNKSYSTVKIIQ